MAYEPLALKYRPKSFADLVGQEHVTRTLKNALSSGRVASAFLFAGSRGVGKTTAARLLALALNCPGSLLGEPEDPVMAEAIFRGEDLDVIEIDGASNRGIDEIRAIRDHVSYAPAQAPYKIYIIDEVHMLTIQAFNALLKTLEEPPPHVKFIFATTEPQAIPETIVSRCQRFQFRRIGIQQIAARLAWICEKEGVVAEEGVLEEIASKAEGGLRDSIGLLEQAISFSGTSLSLADLDRVLGRMGVEELSQLLGHAGRGESGPMLEVLSSLFAGGRDAEEILDQVLEVLREAMVREAGGPGGEGTGRRRDLLGAMSEHWSLDRLLLAMRILLNTRREMRRGGQARLQLDLAFLKIARSSDLLPLGEILEQLRRGGGSAPLPPSPPKGGRTSVSRPAPAALPSLVRIQGEWRRLLQAIREQSPQAGAFLEGARPTALKDHALTLLLPATSSFAQRQLTGAAGRHVEEVLGREFGGRWKLVLELAAKEDQPAKKRQSVLEDRDVRRILDSFDGSVIAVEKEDPS